MNYLSHHKVALGLWADAPPLFFLGNVLPDLFSASGEGRLRESEVQGDSPLARGAQLHIATDKIFHACPTFETAMRVVNDAFCAEKFSTPPRRVFFLAHVFVEVVLDSYLTLTQPELLDHHYAQITLETNESLALEVEGWEGRPLPLMRETLEGVRVRQPLRSYKEPEGIIKVMNRICTRAKLPIWEMDDDKAALTRLYYLALEQMPTWEADLLQPPAFVIA
jgi:hypothetical protein